MKANCEQIRINSINEESIYKSEQLINANQEDSKTNQKKFFEKYPQIGKLFLAGAISMSLLLHRTPAYALKTSNNSEFNTKNQPRTNQTENNFNQKDTKSLLEGEISEINKQNNRTTEVINYGGETFVVNINTYPQQVGTERSGYNANSNILNILGIDTGGIYGNQQSYNTTNRYRVFCNISAAGQTFIGQSSEYAIEANSQSNTNIAGVNFTNYDYNYPEYNIPADKEQEAINNAKSQLYQYLSGQQNKTNYQSQSTYEQPSNYKYNTYENTQQNIELPPNTYIFPNLPDTLDLNNQSYIYFKGLPKGSTIIITISYGNQSSEKVINYQDNDGHLFPLESNKIQQVTGKRDYAPLTVEIRTTDGQKYLKGTILDF